MSDPKMALVVAESAQLRQELAASLEHEEPHIEVGATAPAGPLAVRKLEQLQPDLVVIQGNLAGDVVRDLISDLRAESPGIPVMLRMPSVNPFHPQQTPVNEGFERRITKRLHPPFDEQATTRKVKPLNLSGVAEALEEDSEPVSAAQPGASEFARRPPTLVKGGPIDAIVIGVSTGGPPALAEVLPQLPPGLPPIFVVQHMPAQFTSQLATRLSQQGQVPVIEATTQTPVRPSHCWIAPGDYHMTLRRESTSVLIDLNQDPPVHSSRPSVDVLFKSAADIYGSHLLAVVMTGMGCDGLEGCEAIRAKGGHVLVQDEESSVVWGMPGSVARAGLADEIIPLDLIASTVVRRVQSSRQKILTKPVSEESSR
jgi:two-component system chemotaxis response regulator CheB